jgi:oligopeptide/dipeptide ABC transporter ATP-binding protein
MKPPLIAVQNLKKYFPIKKNLLKAVDDVSFSIHQGETLGLVGESGCGKSTVGKTLLRLLEPTSGKVYFQGTDIFTLSKRDLKQLRKEMQIIFQDPFGSLNPRMTVEDILLEPLEIHQVGTSSTRIAEIKKLLDLVGLSTSSRGKFPHEFSGGQRQRIGIARSLALRPQFLVCDEPISSLDISIQAQIVNLLNQLQQELNLTYLFIAHDLAMVRYLSKKVAVMYLGQLMEIAPAQTLYNQPLHPYTEALISAAPSPDPFIERKRKRIVLQGELPSPINPPKGCPFCTRCPKATNKCFTERPVLKEIRPSHLVACHHIPVPHETERTGLGSWKTTSSCV